jgi:hypothetical protein
MRRYLDDYWDLYWDLHLGVKGDAVPPQVRAIGEAFNTVLAYRNPLQEIVYENYMTVRALRPFLTKWIDERLDDITNGRIADADKTIAYYWLKNAGDGKHFAKRDVVFECFHNFVALSQWGNSIFGIMTRLNENDGDQAVRAAVQKTMSGDFDNANGAPYTPLELRLLARSALCAHRRQRWSVPRQHQRRFRCRLPLADEHLWRTGVDARAVPILRAPDVLEFSSSGDDAARILPAKFSDQPEREPLDDLADGQFQLHARSRLDLD